MAHSVLIDGRMSTSDLRRETASPERVQPEPAQAPGEERYFADLYSERHSLPLRGRRDRALILVGITAGFGIVALTLITMLL